ncbi:MAG: nucleotidyltransferase domain-containing protein [Magnetococcus sp. DMHC-1]
MTGLDIKPEQMATLQSLLRRFLPGVTLWVYGSRVKGTARTYSDLDLVVFTSPDQRSLVLELKEALDESNLPFPADVLVWDDLPASFHRNIEEKYMVVQEGNGKASDQHILIRVRDAEKAVESAR